MTPIYLDNAASTRVADEVLALMTDVMKGAWGNPSAQHPQGAAARGHIDTAKKRMLEALGDKRAPEYRRMEATILAAEEEARYLSRELAVCGWPEAAPKLLELVENAKRRRKSDAACTYALLATEADPQSAEALRSLLGCSLSDFVKLSVLARLARLAPNDAAVARQRAEIRTK